MTQGYSIVIEYYIGHESEASDYLDNPNKLLGDTGKSYMILFTDSVGNSVFRGGRTLIIGYMYPRNEHGAQLAMRYGDEFLRYRIKDVTLEGWRSWRVIQTVEKMNLVY